MEIRNMIELHEFNKVLTILGFKNVQIASIDAFLTKIRTVAAIPLQFFDATFIASEKHLLFATLSALTAFQQGYRISENLEVEILLYASGQRQISKAIKLIGLKQNTSEVAAAFLTATPEEAEKMEAKISKTVPGVRDDSVLGLQEWKVEPLINAFEVTGQELEAVANDTESTWESLLKIIIERSALLATNR
jgi:KEOPS complex subunit Cgi121